MEVYDLSEENQLDTYMREVPVLEGDEARSLTQEELGQGQEDHCWFNHGSPYTISVFPIDTKRYVWLLYQAIWREEHKLEDGFEKIVEECEDPEYRTTWSGRRRNGECKRGDSHLEWPPKIMGFIHSLWVLWYFT